jgi:hypothetical protein
MLALEADHVIRWKERIAVIAIGRTVKYYQDLLFDFILYPTVIATMGPFAGFLLLSSLSASLCRLDILFYDWAKKDWLGLELLKEIRDGEEKKKGIMRIVQWATRRGDWVAFFVLCALTDPFEVTVYMRHGVEKYNGLSMRDWRIFWGSVMVSNLFWAGLVTFAVTLIKAIYGWFIS